MARRSIAAWLDVYRVCKAGVGLSLDDHTAAAETAEANPKQRTGEENKVKRFFAYIPNGFTFHDTAEEAKAEAERMLGIERDFATREGEWSDDASGIMWGEIRGCAEEHWFETGQETGFCNMIVRDIGKLG